MSASIHEPGNLASAWASDLSRLLLLFSLLMSLLPAFAEPAPGVSIKSTSVVSAPRDFVTVSRLGESEQQAAMRVGKLLSRRRTTDPFGFPIRGPFKGLPPVAEHPSATPGQPASGQPNAASQAAAINVPTLEKAIQELSIGGVNVEAREILIKSRAIREGDLLVLESGGRQFVVWVQSVGARGVMFCDIDLKKHILKPLGAAPTELPGDSAGRLPDIGKILNKEIEQ